jgi:hypothetical protein
MWSSPSSPHRRRRRPPVVEQIAPSQISPFNPSPPSHPRLCLAPGTSGLSSPRHIDGSSGGATPCAVDGTLLQLAMDAWTDLCSISFLASCPSPRHRMFLSHRREDGKLNQKINPKQLVFSGCFLIPYPQSLPGWLAPHSEDQEKHEVSCGEGGVVAWLVSRAGSGTAARSLCSTNCGLDNAGDHTPGPGEIARRGLLAHGRRVYGCPHACWHLYIQRRL